MNTWWKVGAVAALICLCVGVVAVGPEVVLLVPLIAVGALFGWLRWRISEQWVDEMRGRMFVVPGPDASVDEMLQFGRSTYCGDVRHRPEELVWIASAVGSHWMATGKGPDSAQIAQAALFFESTREGSVDDAVYDVDYLRALVSRIRRFAPEGQIMADYPGLALRIRRWAAGVPKSERSGDFAGASEDEHGPDK